MTYADEQTITLELGGTATETDDYTVSSKTLTLGAGDDSVTATVIAVQDSLVDTSETITITAKHGSNTSAAKTVTITDDDAVTVSVSAVLVEDDDETPEDESDDKSVVEEGESAMFVVALSGEVSSEVQVSYESSNDTGAGAAEAGKDYTAVSATTLTFTAGDTAKTISVVTLDDDLVEADETFTVELTAVTFPDGVSLDTDADEATGTIKDTDSLPVSIAPKETPIDEGETGDVHRDAL